MLLQLNWFIIPKCCSFVGSQCVFVTSFPYGCLLKIMAAEGKIKNYELGERNEKWEEKRMKIT